MSDENETDRSFDELTGGRFFAPSPDAYDGAAGEKAADGPDTADDPTAGLERPEFWDEGMERELHEAVSDAFRAIVDERKGKIGLQRQCENAFEQLSAAVNDKYNELTGKDLPKSMARNLEQLLTQITQAPLHEPEHGPGLWAKLPQNSINGMVEARPVDLVGSPSRTEIDLMMLHTIRMGRFLTTHYSQWDKALPACWILHDDVVQEIYALKCYADMIVASPNGGLYAPTLQALIRQALDRVKEYLSASNANESNHTHHLSDSEARERERDRRAEYEAWHERSGEWRSEPPFETGWRFQSSREAIDAACDLVTPTRPDGSAAPLTSRGAEWRNRLAALREAWSSGAADALDDAKACEDEIRRAWIDCRARESAARDRVDRASVSAARALRDDDLEPMYRDELERLADQARKLLRDNGKDSLADGDRYRPVSLATQERLADRIGKLTAGRPSEVFDRCDSMLKDIDQITEEDHE